MTNQLVYPEMRPSGPLAARIMCIGEAPGAEEQMLGLPFVGWSGKELTKLLTEAGISREATYMTNVFFRRPHENKIENFCTKNKERGIAGMPALQPGQFVLSDFGPELERLYDEIAKVKPNVICALGNTPSWALFRQTPKITALRGRVREAFIRGQKYKVVPTFHPAYILRNWKDRVILLQDLYKLRRESQEPIMRLPQRRVLIDPTYSEVMNFLDICFKAKELTFDVETKERQITVCGIGISRGVAAVIPFVDTRKEDYCYWPLEQEVAIVKRMRKLLAARGIKMIFQNGMYDIVYFWENWRALILGDLEDTMLIQHALWPELKKDLGTLASVHTDEAGWKTMRLRLRDDFKREE